MSSGPKKPKVIQASAAEKAAHKLAQDQRRNYISTFRPLEDMYAAEAGQDFTGRLVGQTTSGAMRASTGSLQAAALGAAPVDTAALAADITRGGVGARATARRMTEDSLLSALGVGNGIATAGASSLSSAGRYQTEAAIANGRAAIAKDQADASWKEALVGGVAGLAGAYGTYKYLSGAAAPAAQAPVVVPQMSLNTAMSPGALSPLDVALGRRRQTPMF